MATTYNASRQLTVYNRNSKIEIKAFVANGDLAEVLAKSEKVAG